MAHARRIAIGVLTLPQQGPMVVQRHVELWTRTFWETWDPLPFDQKLAWIVFVGQTVGVLTLLELFLLKK